MTLQWERIADTVIRRATLGLSETLEWTAERARDKAPVRDVFQRGRNRPEAVKRGIQYTRSGDIKRDRFGKAIFVKRSYNTDQTRRQFLAKVDRQKARNRQAYVQFPDATTGDLRSTRVRGNPRSTDPLFKRTVKGKRKIPVYAPGLRKISHTVAGKARLRIDPETGDFILPSATFFTRKGVVTREKGKEVTAARFLSHRGRDELKRGAAVIAKARREGTDIGEALDAAGSGVHQVSEEAEGQSGSLELGGRLRDSIEASDVRDDGKTISGEVFTEVPYARYQEYGTSRHRAQPFMRPALYESRQVLVNNVKKVLARRGA